MNSGEPLFFVAGSRPANPSTFTGGAWWFGGRARRGRGGVCDGSSRYATPDQAELYAAMISIAKHELDKPGLAEILRRRFASQ